MGASDKELVEWLSDVTDQLLLFHVPTLFSTVLT